jgi:hypothetical protein
MIPKLIALARATDLRGHALDRHAKHFRSGHGVDVDPVGEGLCELRNVGDMGEHPKLDLAVVGRNQHIAGFGDEGGADLAAFRCAHRNVLDVRIRRGQPSGGCRRHRKRRVHPLGLRVDVPRKRVGVGGFELGQLPPVDDLARQLMSGGSQILQHLGRCRPLPGLGFRATRQIHLVEQDLAQLFGRTDIEVFPGQLLDFASRAAAPCASSPDSRDRICRSTRMPRCSMRIRTGASGRSSRS